VNVTFLQGLYIVLGILGGGGVAGLARGLWRMVSAVARLIDAMDHNTRVTADLAHDMVALRKVTHRRDRELAARISQLEANHDRQGTENPGPSNRGARWPGPERGRRMGALRRL